VSKSVPHTIYPVSENTITIRVGTTINSQVNHNVFRVYYQLLQNRHSAWLDIIPAYATVSIVYDVLSIRNDHASALEWMKTEIDRILAQPYSSEKLTSRNVIIPVCYEDSFALDRKTIASNYKLDWEEVISIHSAKTYQVFMIGFVPGFAYMGMVDKRIAFPRLEKPRALVPAGSIGIAGEQTGIYPLDSPGGWNVIGRTPLRVFDATGDNPVLLQPNDAITFKPISKKEFDSFDQSTFDLIPV